MAGDATTDWRDVHVGFEGDGVKIGGLQVWKHKWRSVGAEPIELPHPAHRNERHRYCVYEIGDPEHPVRFAAGELSNGVYGFYVPT